MATQKSNEELKCDQLISHSFSNFVAKGNFSKTQKRQNQMPKEVLRWSKQISRYFNSNLDKIKMITSTINEKKDVFLSDFVNEVL